MESSVHWEHGLAFTGHAGESGLTLALDADPAVGGAGAGFLPLELMLLSLAGCTAMDVISILLKKRQPIRGFEVRVQGERSDEHPRVFTHLTVRYLLRGTGIDRTAVERAIELSKTKYCPAQAMLSRSVQIDHVYEISEEPDSSGAGA